MNEVNKFLKESYDPENLKEDLKTINDKLDTLLDRKPNDVERTIESCVRLTYEDNYSVVKSIRLYRSLTNCDLKTGKEKVEHILFNK